MKFNTIQPEPQFIPFTITVETKEEALILLDLFSMTTNQYYAKVLNQPLQEIESVWIITTYIDIKSHLGITKKYTNTHKIVGIND